MSKRILLAAVLGGLALFFWGALSHMALGLGDAGMEYLPTQQPVMDALKASVPDSGFYMFPEGDKAGNLPAETAGGAYGLLLYHSSGASGMKPGQLLNEALLDIVLAYLASLLLSLASGMSGYTARVGFVFLVGLIPALMTHFQYWNWYRFPTTFTLASMLDNAIGFLCVGLVAAAFVKPAGAPVVAIPKAA